MPITVFGLDVGMIDDGNKDTAINQTNPTIGLGTRNPIVIRSGAIIYYLSRYELSSIDVAANVSSAILTLKSQVLLLAGTYSIHRLLTNWGQTDTNAGIEQNPAANGQATWDNAYDYNGVGDVGWAAGVGVGFGAGDYNAAVENSQAIPATGATANFDITAMIQDMVTNPANNYGFLVMSNRNPNNAIFSFAAAAATDAPYLTVNYTIPSTGITHQSHTAISNTIAIM